MGKRTAKEYLNICEEAHKLPKKELGAKMVELFEISNHRSFDYFLNIVKSLYGGFDLDLQNNSLAKVSALLAEAVEKLEEAKSAYKEKYTENLIRLSNIIGADDAENKLDEFIEEIEQLSLQCEQAKQNKRGRKHKEEVYSTMLYIAEYWERILGREFTQGFTFSAKDNLQLPRNEAGLFTYCVFLLIEPDLTKFTSDIKPAFVRQANAVVTYRKQHPEERLTLLS